MIKDTEQKLDCAKFCATQYIVPFLEVVVSHPNEVSDSETHITDIDVLGVSINKFGHIERYLFDCKTQAKLSPINRALWAAGAARFTDAARSFVVLKKDAPESHRLAASSVNVHLHSEDSFRRYATSLDINFLRKFTYLEVLDGWSKLQETQQKYPKLEALARVSSGSFLLEPSAARALRRLVGVLSKVRGELDPSKPDHRQVFLSTLSVFILLMAACIQDLKDLFDFKLPKEDFERIVRYYIWEGKENYELRRKLRHAFEVAKGSEENVEFDLPGWEKFLHLTRIYLEAPHSVPYLALPAKELAFREVMKHESDYDTGIKIRLTNNGRGRQFLFAAASYLVSACQLPGDFSKQLEKTVNDLL
ncbi:hypothetical protein HHL28_17435 [Aerophototrophica crusticola]|uniref:Uncharacterized protein n=1 Tax=Aerophototrophica crusticola TaxID=1709002 RepID=A0A858RAX3_9PROT|nr:hypothetical protein HHL28_17435 [Rhodospirillaceae bacterium B3]